MMTGTENILAKKYAQAFLNLYINELSFDNYCTLTAAAQYLKKNSTFFSLLDIPLIPLKQKRTILFSILEQLEVPKRISALIDLLIKHQRIILVPAVITALGTVYEQRKKISPFVISSAHTLGAKTLEELKKFLEQETQMQVPYTFVHDKSLIAGIRMQSPQFLWEYSVAKQLNSLYKTMK